MATGVIIYGKSGSGKSRSLKNFKDDEILYVNVEGKPLPFRNRFKNVIHTINGTEIIKALKEMPAKNLKTAVIDDVGYLMTEYFMRHHRNMKGNQVFELYNDLGDLMFCVLNVVKSLPDDIIVYYMFHEDKTDTGDVKVKTIGRLLDNVVLIEGKFTIVLRCMSEDGEHFFRTATDGDDITKAPENMFKDVEIENDLKMVDDTIREFYGM